MAKHHPDLIFCRKQAGVAIGRLCDKKGFTILKVEILLVSIKYFWRLSFWRELKRITLISATDDVSFAIPTFDRLLLCASVTSVITVPSRDVVWFVVVRGYRTLTTAESAPSSKRTEMVAQRLSILAQRRLTCSTKERSLALKRLSNIRTAFSYSEGGPRQPWYAARK